MLRYWEQEFPQLKSIKRRGNRRYYQRRDVILIRQVQSLLYEHGFTIGGARQWLLKNSGAVVESADRTRQVVHKLRVELEDVLHLLQHGE